MEVLYRDERFVAVTKPAGVVVHRSAGVWEAAALQQVRDQVGARVYPVHRLDRATHGVLVFALDAEASRRLGLAFMRGEVQKQYLAVVRGHAPQAGLIDSPLRDEDDRDSPARDAVTYFRTLSTVELPIPVGRYATARYSSVALEPKTGRTHQLRRHLAHLRHPIVGDVRHGDGRHNRLFREHFGLHRMLLFARRLRFVHPFDERVIELSAAIDPPAASILERLGLCDLPEDAA